MFTGSKKGEASLVICSLWLLDWCFNYYLAKSFRHPFMPTITLQLISALMLNSEDLSKRHKILWKKQENKSSHHKLAVVNEGRGGIFTNRGGKSHTQKRNICISSYGEDQARVKVGIR